MFTTKKTLLGELAVVVLCAIFNIGLAVGILAGFVLWNLTVWLRLTSKNKQG